MQKTDKVAIRQKLDPRLKVAQKSHFLKKEQVMLDREVQKHLMLEVVLYQWVLEIEIILIL